MKRSLLVLLILLSIDVSNCTAQIFQKSFGGTGGDWVNTVFQTYDGGFIIGGFTNSYSPTNGNLYLIKTNIDGDTLWTKTYGGIGWDYGNCVQQCADSGFIFLGRTSSFGAGLYDVYLIKTDVLGNLLWSKTFGGTADESGKTVQQTIDGGFIITGNTKSFGAGNADVYLLKTDSIGALQWSKTFGGAFDDYGYSVQQCTDSGFIVSGYTCSYGTGGCDAYLIKTNVNGDTIWTKTYGGAMPDGGYSVKQCLDGGFIMTGKTNSYGVGNGDVYLLKIDGSGIPQWTKTFGGANLDFGNSVQQTSDGGFIIAGLFTPPNTTNTDVYLIRTDTNGDTLWTKTYGGGQEDEGAFVSQCNDKGYIIGSWTLGFGVGDWEIYIIKSDSTGNSGCNEKDGITFVNSPTSQFTNPSTLVSSGCTSSSPATLVGSGCTITNLCTSIGFAETSIDKRSSVIFPNPSNGKFSVTFISEKSTYGRIEILNTLGETIFESGIQVTQGENIIPFINSNKLQSGFYFFKMTLSEKTFVNEILIQK